MKRRRLTKHLALPKSYEKSRLSSESMSFRESSSISREKRLSQETARKGPEHGYQPTRDFVRNQAQWIWRFIFYVAGEDKCQVQKINAKFPRINTNDRRKMESFREVLNSTTCKKEGGTNLKGYIRGAKAKGERERFLRLIEILLA